MKMPSRKQDLLMWENIEKTYVDKEKNYYVIFA